MSQDQETAENQAREFKEWKQKEQEKMEVCVVWYEPSKYINFYITRGDRLRQ